MITFKCLFSILFVLMLSSCTYSITMVHTSGEASDVVEEAQTTTPTVSPKLNIPTKPV